MWIGESREGGVWDRLDWRTRRCKGADGDGMQVDYGVFMSIIWSTNALFDMEVTRFSDA